MIARTSIRSGALVRLRHRHCRRLRTANSQPHRCPTDITNKQVQINTLALTLGPEESNWSPSHRKCPGGAGGRGKLTPFHAMGRQVTAIFGKTNFFSAPAGGGAARSG
jgi:hypothetical protein